MLNLEALFGTAETLIDQAVDTAGLTLESATEVVDIADSDLTKTIVRSDVRSFPGIVIVATPGGVSPAPPVEVRAGDWIVLVKASQDPPVDQQVLTVMTARNGLLSGEKAKILGQRVDTSGAYRMLYARPGE